VRSVETTPALARLATYRLEHDLTFEELADEMKASGYPLIARTLARLTNGLQRKPLDRTLFKIDRFIATLDDANGHKPKRRKKAKR